MDPAALDPLSLADHASLTRRLVWAPGQGWRSLALVTSALVDAFQDADALHSCMASITGARAARRL